MNFFIKSIVAIVFIAIALAFTSLIYVWNNDPDDGINPTNVESVTNKIPTIAGIDTYEIDQNNGMIFLKVWLLKGGFIDFGSIKDSSFTNHSCFALVQVGNIRPYCSSPRNNGEILAESSICINTINTPKGAKITMGSIDHTIDNYEEIINLLAEWPNNSANSIVFTKDNAPSPLTIYEQYGTQNFPIKCWADRTIAIPAKP